MADSQSGRGKIPGPDSGIEVKKSICNICDPRTQCGLDLYVRDGKIIKVEGTKENPHNGGTLCSKGAATRQFVYNQDRLKTPLKRVGPKGSGEFVPVSWEEAMDTIAGRFKEFKNRSGAESVAFYVGYPKWMRPFAHRLAVAFGSPNYMSESSTCSTATTMAWKLNFGAPGVPDIKNAQCLMTWSANPFHTNTAIVRNLLAAKERGLKIIAVDPRFSPMAGQADIHLQLRPGTDGALALAMAHVIINENLYDRDFVEQYTGGFAEFRDYVQGFSPEKGEELTGVPAAKIREAARLYAGTKPAAVLPSAAPVAHNTNGVQNYRAVFALIALTGNYDIRGGNLVEPVTYLYQQGGFVSRAEEYTHPRKLSELPPRIGDERFPVWSELTDEAQAMHLPDQINSQKPYPVRAVFGMGLNYRMWPDSANMAESLKKLDFFVNVDLFFTDSCKLADIVLPACSSVERSEFRCYSQNYAVFSEPAIEPLYESRSDAEIIFDLAKRLNIDDPLLNAGFEASMDYIIEPGGISVAELKKHPGGMYLPNPVKPPEKKYLKNGFKTPSGKVEFKSLLLEKYQDYGYQALPVFMPPKYSRENTPEIAAEYPWMLNSGSRLPMFIHSRTFRLPWTRSLRPDPAADLNPQDAEKLRIKQGDAIRLSTPKGSIIVKANLTQIVQPGVVHMYHGYAEADVNSLLEPDYLDPVSGFPGFKALLCRIDKA